LASAADHRAFLGGVVDLDVPVLAGDAGDALGLERQARGLHVGDALAALGSGMFQLEPGVAEVLVLGDDGDAGGAG
jgi:hypothetical protein